MNHGVRRELFVMPLAKNACEFLRGEHQRLLWFNQPADELAEFYRERWLVPRAKRSREFSDYSNEAFRLWKKGRRGTE